MYERPDSLKSYLITFNENIHFGRYESFRDLSSVWKDNSAIRVSGMSLQMCRPNTLTPLSPNVNQILKPCIK